MTSKKKLVIDVDTGTDDAQAIMLALSHPDADVLAITCVHGNTNVHQAALNTLRVLKVCDRLDIPVYQGAPVSLLGEPAGKSSGYHGSDGLGDSPDPEAPPASLIQQEPAVQALLRLAKQHQGELTLVALAPLTNIALAIRLDPDFGKRLKEVVIMGGNMHATGSRVSLTADFNFVADPEAAHVCLSELQEDVTVVPYDVCSRTTIEWDVVDAMHSQPSPKAQFVAQITKTSLRHKRLDLGLTAYFTCDPLAMLVALDGSSVVTGVKKTRFRVELAGSHTRGLSVLDRDVSSELHTVVTEIDISVLVRRLGCMLA